MVVRHSLAYLSVQKWFAGDVHYYVKWKFGRNWPTPFENADFQSIFTHSASAITPALNAGRCSCDKAVRPSVCQTRDLWQNEWNFAHILILHERPFILLLWQEERLVGCDHFSLKFWVKLALLEGKHRFSVDMSLRWTSQVAPKAPKGLKNAKRRFPTEIALLWPYRSSLSRNKTNTLFASSD